MTSAVTDKKGYLYAIAAYFMWGVAPIYFKAIDQVPPLEILAHRIIWSFFLVFLVIVLARNLHRVQAVLKAPKQLAVLALATCLIAFNWFLYIWAVTNNHILEASLGYFINPLLNVAIGMFVFGERLRKLQWVAVAIVIAGVSIELIAFGSIPWIALALAGSFATYGAIRKKLPVDSITGLWLEVTILMPVTLLYFFFFAQSDTSNMFNNTWVLNTLLISAGVITTLPLLSFIAAAQRIRYSTLGFFQYIGPTLMFLIAIFVYAEELDPNRLTTFAFIWTAIVVYSIDAILHHSKSRKKV